MRIYPTVRLSRFVRIVNLLAVVIPFLGLVAAITLLWGWGVGWLHLALLIVGYILTILGITVGYHRLFTHQAFRTNAVVKFVLGVLGSMSAQGPILQWVATHRLHHQHSDSLHDPHSPHGNGVRWRGVLHAHLGWFFTPSQPRMERYVPDLLADGVIRWVSRTFLFWVLLGLVLPAATAFALTGRWRDAVLGLVWGGLVRVFLVHHVTWSVNSVCHLWGSRPFNSHDESRNNVLMGIFAFGEGWHNTHHAFPTSARHGLRWWEIDVSYWVIRALAVVGLARGIRVPTAERLATKRRRTFLPSNTELPAAKGCPIPPTAKMRLAQTK